MGTFTLELEAIKAAFESFGRCTLLIVPLRFLTKHQIMLKLLFLSIVLTVVKSEQDHVHDTVLHHSHSDSHKYFDKEHVHTHKEPHQVVQHEYLTAFQTYSRNLLKQSNYYDAYEKTGVVSYCTFTVGHLLANINEQPFNVRSAGIAKALELPRENISAAYSAILDSFLEDPAVKGSSTLYVPGSSFALGPNFKNLHTVADVLPLYGNSAASSYINRQIGLHTSHAIVDRLVPHDPFNASAAGVFGNTFYYKNNWKVPFTSVGEKPFYTDEKEVQVRTLEVTGTFPYVETDHYSAVAIPFVGESKQMIFVRPKKSIQEYLLLCVDDIFTSKGDPASWYKRLVRVQVPYLNLVLGRNYQAQLDALAGTETSCCGRPDPGETVDPAVRHYVQPIVQVLSARLSPEGYELAVANGAQVNKGYPPEEGHAKSEQVVETNAQTKVPDMEFRVESAKYTRQGHDMGVADFVVNNPFFMYLRDNVLGPVSYTAVRSTFDISLPEEFTKARPHEIDISTSFSEECKFRRWNCHERH